MQVEFQHNIPGEGPDNPEARSIAKTWAIRSSCLTLLAATLSQALFAVSLYFLRKLLWVASLPDNTFDFSSADWCGCFIPMFAACLSAAPLLLAGAFCENAFLSTWVPTPRSHEQREMVTNVIALFVVGAFDRVLIASFWWLIYMRLEGQNDLSIDQLFTPWWILYGVSFLVRHALSYYYRENPWQPVHHCQSWCAAITFSWGKNLPALVLALPIMRKLNGSWPADWPKVVFMLWFSLALLLLLLVVFLVWILYQAIVSGGGLSFAATGIFACAVIALVPVPMTYGLAMLTARLDGDLSVTVDHFMIPFLISNGFVGWFVLPLSVPLQIAARRQAIEADQAGGGVNDGQELQPNMFAMLRAASGQQRQQHHEIVEHSNPSQIHRLGSSLFTLASNRILYPSRGRVEAGDALELSDEEIEDGCTNTDGVAGTSTAVERGTKYTHGEDDGVCVVCMEHGKNAILIPCGHGDTCMSCARKIAEQRAKCPICRSIITEVREFGAEHRMEDGTYVITSPGGFTVK